MKNRWLESEQHEARSARKDGGVSAINATRDRALVGYYFSVACLFYAAKSWRKAKEVR